MSRIVVFRTGSMRFFSCGFEAAIIIVFLLGILVQIIKLDGFLTSSVEPSVLLPYLRIMVSSCQTKMTVRIQ